MTITELNKLIAAKCPNGAPEWIRRDMEVITALTIDMVNAQGRDRVNFFRNEIQLTKAPIIKELTA